MDNKQEAVREVINRTLEMAFWEGRRRQLLHPLDIPDVCASMGEELGIKLSSLGVRLVVEGELPECRIPSFAWNTPEPSSYVVEMNKVVNLLHGIYKSAQQDMLAAGYVKTCQIGEGK